MLTTPTIHNFSAGPAVLPKPVLEEAASECCNFQNTGMSIMELSHRSKEFDSVLRDAEKRLRGLLSIPENYKVLFLQGGASLQFAALLMNLVVDKETQVVEYMVNGVWSAKAMEEAKKLGYKVHQVFNTKSSGYTSIPPSNEWSFVNSNSSSKPAFTYFCSNETINGVEWPADAPEPATPHDKTQVPLICDMSSNILSRPVDVSKYGVIFGGAQKNIGPAGLTVVIIREDLVRRREGVNTALPVPTMLDYKIMADNNSLYNTPPTWGIYLAGLVFKWMEEQGGMKGIAAKNARKSQLLYDTITAFPKFYSAAVQDKRFQSRMNIPFRIRSADGFSEDLEKLFVKEAEARGMVQLKGHRSVGGLRASLYNALEESSVVALCEFMKEFAAKYG